MKKALLPLLLALLLPATAHAQDQKDPCDEAESTVEITQCLRQDFDRADAELNRVYRAAMDHIEASDHVPADKRQEWKEKLRAARRLLERGELETAGVRELVAEAGMSSRAFYELFESRDALVLELAEAMVERFLERLDAVPDPADSGGAVQVTDRLLDVYVEAAAPLIALDGARLPRSTAERLQEIRAELLEKSLDRMYVRFERAVRAGRLTALPDRTAYEITVRGVESLTADLSRRGRLSELASLRAPIRELLLSQMPLAPGLKRR